MALSITIESSRVVEERGKSYVAYLLRVEGHSWDNLVEKRYSEFLELHRVMKLLNRVVVDELPKFPGQMIFKTIFRKVTEEDIEQRKQDLQTYLNILVNTNCARNSAYFAQFMGMPKSVRENWIRGIPI
jgi:hypothetical protein